MEILNTKYKDIKDIRYLFHEENIYNDINDIKYLFNENEGIKRDAYYAEKIKKNKQHAKKILKEVFIMFRK